MSRRGLLIALIVSLAVNLFVLGGLAGAALMGLPLHRPPPQGPPPRLAAMGATLSPKQRDAWQATILQTAQTVGPKLGQARALRTQAWLGLAADPVKPQAALAALDQAKTLEFQARSEMDRAVVGFAATLPVEERRRLGEAFGRPRPPPGHDCLGGRHGPDGEPLPDR